ncbi:MAG: rhomboid family intramembrane serine protease [Bradymonadaceae bacterium]
MFFPYDDINPTESTPWVTWVLIAVNVVIFFLTLDMLQLPPERQLAALRSTGALVPAEPEARDFFISMFLHGSLSHLLGNMLFLYITGDNVEDRFGSPAYLVFYLACGVAGGLTHLFLSPASTTPTIGASGAISGVMGAYIVLFPHSEIKIFYWFYFWIGRTLISAKWWIGLWFGFQLLAGSAATAGGGGVAYGAHVGGFVAGAGIAWVAYRAGWVEAGVDYSAGRDRDDEIVYR